VTYGPDRTEALSTMAKALDSYVIRGKRIIRSLAPTCTRLIFPELLDGGLVLKCRLTGIGQKTKYK